MARAVQEIIWLDDVVQKLGWKHNVLPMEVEEVLTGDQDFPKGEGTR